jgi:WbqC-like protein family
MRAGVIQSCYIPWRGYFDFIDSVDVFVLYDDVQYSTGGWQNRNRIKLRSGVRWLSVPVRYRFGDPIDAVAIGAPTGASWQETHQRALRDSLGPAPYFAHAMEVWEGAVACGDTTLSALNARLIEGICGYLGITTRIIHSRDYALTGAKTERLLSLLKKLGATRYLSGPRARDYLEEDLFEACGIGLEYKSYDYPSYPQLWGEFVGTVTVLDLIANCGPKSGDFLKSMTPSEEAVPAQT